jgi:hypothetical protein
MKAGDGLLVLLLGGSMVPGAAVGSERALAHAAHDAARRGDAFAILAATRDRYREMQALVADGDATIRMTTAGHEKSTTSRFSLRLARPRRYRITWTADGGDGAPTGDGAVWNAGTGAYIYTSVPGAYAPVPSDDDVMGMGTGGSQGVANDLPALFFNDPSALTELTAPTLDGTEPVEGEPCWKISGASPTARHATLWISVRRLVVRQVLRSQPSVEALGGSDGTSGEELDRDIRAAGLDPTPERRAEFRTMLDVAKAAAKLTATMAPTIMQVYRNVRVDGPVRDADFDYAVPPGTPLVRSLLEAVFPSGPSPPPAPPAPRTRGGNEKAPALLEQVRARYRRLSSLRADGEIVERYGPMRDSAGVRSHFAVILARPGRYRIAWGAGRTNDRMDGAVWNAGDGAWEYSHAIDAFAPEATDRSALATTAGVSKGLTQGVPSLFLHDEGWLTTMHEPTLQGTEAIDGELCDVVSDASGADETLTLWISRDLLIRRHRHETSATPAEAAKQQMLVEVATGQLKETATPEEKPLAELMGEVAKMMAKHPELAAGSTTVTYHDLRVDDPVGVADVTFEPPSDAMRKSSLTDGMFAMPTFPTPARPQ